MKLPSLPIATGHPINAWLRKLRNAVSANQPIGENIVYSPNGWSQNTSYDNTNVPTFWSGPYNDAQSYTKGEIVYVENAKSYMSTDNTGAVTAVNSLPGIYVCTYNVPVDLRLSDFEGITPANNAVLYNWIQTQIKREENVCYAPIYPHPDYEPTNLPVNAKQGKYWHLIAFAPILTNMCIDGEPVDVYVNMTESGSSLI